MAATAPRQPAVRAKEFHFPLSVEWTGDRRVTVHVAGRHVIEVTPPPLVAAAASCLAVTFTGLAERAQSTAASLPPRSTFPSKR
jgi:hypothetical protein